VVFKGQKRKRKGHVHVHIQIDRSKVKETEKKEFNSLKGLFLYIFEKFLKDILWYVVFFY
jgi:hypothetical protein